jgi:hypothetical protein
MVIMKGKLPFLACNLCRFNKGNALNIEARAAPGCSIRPLMAALILASCCLDAALADVEGAQPVSEGLLTGDMPATDLQSGPDPELNHDGQSGSDGSRSGPVPMCRRTVDSLVNLTENLTFPEHLAIQDAAKTGKEFDVNSYFSILDHLSMQPGYILDYVYFFEGIGGEPVIYARKAGVPAYRRYSEYASDRNMTSPFTDRSGYLEHVMTDGTPEGYFQYALLYIMGGQFYLYWHANYNDQKVVCDISEARAIIESLKGQGSQPMYPEILNNFGQDDFSPVVQFRGDEAHVRLVVFTEWGGFIRKDIAIRREFPHSVLNDTSKAIIPYDSGINF